MLSPPALLDVLADAREAGFLGPGPVEAQVVHAEGFAEVARGLASGGTAPRILDLGSGGGVPGLVVATMWPESSLVLLEANGRRSGFLRRSVERLELLNRVTVLQDRAEVAGRDPLYRGGFDGVLARSFGRPAATAECGAPFLRPGGWLVVSEPPVSTETGGSEETRKARGGTTEELTASPREGRWPAEALAQFGLEPLKVVGQGPSYQVLLQMEPCPERFPRRDGVPAKRPLF
jgi:16S rRNA (guanine527-N7)-methyltransferase